MELRDALNDPARRDGLIAACVVALRDEVDSKRGVSGLAIRSGYAAFEKVRPGITKAAFARLLPRFAPAIEPFLGQARASGNPDQYFAARAGEVADALLEVTDDLAARARNPILVATYRSLRGLARPHVIAAVPRIPRLLAVVSHGEHVV